MGFDPLGLVPRVELDRPLLKSSAGMLVASNGGVSCGGVRIKRCGFSLQNRYRPNNHSLGADGPSD